MWFCKVGADLRRFRIMEPIGPQNANTPHCTSLEDIMGHTGKWEAPKVGSHWQHHNGNKYVIVPPGVCIIESTLEPSICYRSVNPDHDIPWIRPLSSWWASVVVNGREVPRFKLLSSTDEKREEKSHVSSGNEVQSPGSKEGTDTILPEKKRKPYGSGDDGYTSLLGGSRTRKTDQVFSALGELDILSSYIGYEQIKIVVVILHFI